LKQTITFDSKFFLTVSAFLFRDDSTNNCRQTLMNQSW
jgi:hypothetical protein